MAEADEGRGVPAGRLETLVALGDTLAGSPAQTIKPQPLADSGGKRAVAHLDSTLADPAGARQRLELHEVLGEGGMGIVWRGTQVTMGRDVAVKALRSARLSEANRVQLLQEAWLTGALEHPNILPVYGIEAGSDGEPLIVLKRLDNRRWSDVMHDADTVREVFGATDLAEWNLRVFLQICNAVSFAHSRRVVHLDLKPDNVLIGGFGEVYVVDWGVAVSLDPDPAGRLPHAAKREEIVGSPAYMAPEMLEGDGARLDERTDVYLLGACLYELTEHRAPHWRETVGEILHHAASGQLDPLQRADPELAQIITRAMAADPAQRYPNADTLRQAIQQFLDHRDSRSRSDEAAEHLDELKEALADAADDDADRDRRLAAAFGACRFGFRGALGVWPGNEAAKAGLAEAVTLMVGYELSRGNPSSAATLAAELDEIPAALAERIEAARAEEARERERIEALERIGTDHDERIGRRTRAFLVLMLGAIWAGFALVGHYLVELRMDSPLLWQFPLASFGVVAALSVWARHTLMRTQFNRRAAATLLIAPLAQLGLALAGRRVGMSLDELGVALLALFTALTTMYTVLADRQLAPTALAYAVGTVWTAFAPSQVLLVLTAINAVFVANIAIWWPWSEAARRARGELDET